MASAVALPRSMMVTLFEVLVMKRELPKYYGKFKLRTALGNLALHLAFVAAIYWAIVNGGFTQVSIILAVVFYIFPSAGIILGYHRMETHASFRAVPWLKNALLVFACFAQQFHALWWCAVHRYHHRYNDAPGDPHSPNDGLLWAHFLWTFWEYNHPKLYEIVERDLAKDPDVLRQKKYYMPVSLSLFIIPPLIGGITGGLYGAFDAFFAAIV
jgi:stearoyl-CoA desaturase (Delta-9 desaturase)